MNARCNAIWSPVADLGRAEAGVLIPDEDGVEDPREGGRLGTLLTSGEEAVLIGVIPDKLDPCIVGRCVDVVLVVCERLGKWNWLVRLVKGFIEI